jgi:fido (protein-threonine AMPylation protein)
MNQRRRDEQEARNAAEVMAWIEHLAGHPEVTINRDLIYHIDRLTLVETDRDYWAGCIRSEVDWQEPWEWSRPRAIVALEKPGLAVADEHTGALLVKFPLDREVGPLFDELLAWLNAANAARLHPVVRAAIFHQRFTAIHPFRDGNGRTARALTTLLLWRAGFPLEVLILQHILDKRREAHINALRAADRGNLTGWVRFFSKAVRDALREGKSQHA